VLELPKKAGTAGGAELCSSAQLLFGRGSDDRATFRFAITTADGPKSFVIEFDVATKLPVWMKQWGNSSSGPPASL